MHYLRMFFKKEKRLVFSCTIYSKSWENYRLMFPKPWEHWKMQKITKLWTLKITMTVSVGQSRTTSFRIQENILWKALCIKWGKIKILWYLEGISSGQKKCETTSEWTGQAQPYGEFCRISLCGASKWISNFQKTNIQGRRRCNKYWGNESYPGNELSILL